MRVVDDDGVDRADDVPGHLWVRGDSAASGYYGNADATRVDVRSRRWMGAHRRHLRARQARECTPTWVDRTTCCAVGGEWVAPAEVEATIIEHPSVLEVAIVGEVDDRGITRPVAYVVAKPGVTVTEAEVIEHCRNRLAGFKRPSKVVVMEALPKTATGKIQRFKLRQPA